MWEKFKEAWIEYWIDVRVTYRDIWSKWGKERRARLKRNALRRAVRVANKRHEADNRRYYVLLDYNNKYQAINRDEFIALRRAGVFDKKITMADVMRVSAYMTKSKV